MERSPPPRSIDASDWWRDEGKLNREGGLVEGEGRPMGRRDEVKEGERSDQSTVREVDGPTWLDAIGRK